MAIVYPGVYPSGFLLIEHFQQSLVPQPQTQFSPSFVRSTPESGHVRCSYRCPLWAKSGLMQRSEGDCYSITSSARASNCGGTSNPIFLAVLRLTASSNFVGC
jgi:hypothetical protein